jgi:hypothetical protein
LFVKKEEREAFHMRGADHLFEDVVGGCLLVGTEESWESSKKRGGRRFARRREGARERESEEARERGSEGARERGIEGSRD